MRRFVCYYVWSVVENKRENKLNMRGKFVPILSGIVARRCWFLQLRLVVPDCLRGTDCLSLKASLSYPLVLLAGADADEMQARPFYTHYLTLL